MKTQFEKWIYISVPIIVALSAAGRHIYNLANKQKRVGIFKNTALSCTYVLDDGIFCKI